MGGTLESSEPHSLLRDRVVLISGGTAGLGAGIARAAAREGATVAVSGRRREPGDALVAELRAAGTKALFVKADVGEVAQARACAAAAIAEFGRVDSLVNAAGLTSRGTLLDTTPELFDAHIAVNLKAPFFLMQAVVADLAARKAPGTIVNIISTSAHAGQPYLAPYVAAKAGLAGLTRNAAHAHRWNRIRINGLNIGWTDTEAEDATQRRFHGAGDDWRARPAHRCRWASWGRSTRSPSSWCSCCPTGPAWSPARSSTGTRTCWEGWTDAARTARPQPSPPPRPWPACQPSRSWYSATRCLRWPNRSPDGSARGSPKAPGRCYRPGSTGCHRRPTGFHAEVCDVGSELGRVASWVSHHLVAEQRTDPLVHPHAVADTPLTQRRLDEESGLLRDPARSDVAASQRHSMSSMPAVVTAHWQTARTAVVATPRLRARGSTQYPTSAAPGSPSRKPTRPSRVAVAASSATNSARRPSSQPAIYACSTWNAASSSR